MPIEIKELVVRAKVNEQLNTQAAGKSNGNHANQAEHCDNDSATGEIKRSVDTMWDILKRQLER